MTEKQYTNYGAAICEGFDYLLGNDPSVFIIGQGLWSPWYVGNSMTDLDKKYGVKRIIDTPVSESACTGAAVGAALNGMKPIVVHPRMDFMLYGLDSIVNQAAKWSYMFGGQAHPGVVIRAIINRGGEQGAQHSQALHSWFSHIPGLRVVMPYSVQDARDLLISACKSPDPVIYIDDRWLYSQEAILNEPTEIPLNDIKPHILESGTDITIVGCGFSTKIALEASEMLKDHNLNAEVIDLRVLNPIDPCVIISSVKKTGKLLVVDGGWKSCGISAEVISLITESSAFSSLKCPPTRVTLPDAPAPTSKLLETAYYPTSLKVYNASLSMLGLV